MDDRQWSIVNRQWTMVNRQSSTVNRQSSINNICLSFQLFGLKGFLIIKIKNQLAMKTNFNSLLTPILFIAVISGSAVSCRTAELPIHDDLKSNIEVFEVKGKQGPQIGQTLSFGDFKTSKVKRGWTLGYSIPFIVRFQGAKEKLSFSQFTSNGNSAEVALVSKFRETEYAPAKDYFSVSLNYKNYFAGGIKLNNSDDSWDFIVYNVDGASRNLKQNTSVGLVRNSDTQIDIKGIRELQESSQFITQNNVYGYEF